MSISSLVLELLQFSFIRDWPETWKSNIPSPEFQPISGDWDELVILNLVRMFLIKFYWMLQNPRVTAFTVFWVIKEKLIRIGDSNPLPPRLSTCFIKTFPAPKFQIKCCAFIVLSLFFLVFDKKISSQIEIFDK